MRLINAGVSGDTTAGGLERVAWSIEPDWTRRLLRWVVTTCCVALPRSSPREPDGHFGRIAEGPSYNLVVGTHAPNNYGPDYKQQFDQIFPQLAEQYGASYIPSFFEPFITDGQLDESASQYFQPDGIHPNATGVKMVVEFVGPSLWK